MMTVAPFMLTSPNSAIVLIFVCGHPKRSRVTWGVELIERVSGVVIVTAVVHPHPHVTGAHKLHASVMVR